MSINELPGELLQMILLNLPPSDRLECSLVCRKWAEEVSSMSCLEDCWFNLYGGHMETSVPLLIKSSRQYSNLRVYGAKLCMDSELWSNVGRHLRCLDLIDCDLESHVFYFIIRHCPQLLIINLRGDSPKEASNRLQAPTGESLHQTFQSCNVLEFVTNYTVTKEAIHHILKMMPKLNVLQVGNESNMQELLPCFLETAHMFTTLDVSFAKLSDEDLVVALQKLSGSLHKLYLKGSNLTRAAYPAISGCAKLTSLFLEDAHDFDDGHLDNLVRSAPNLEGLSFRRCRAITDTGLSYLSELRGLYNLSICSCDGISTDALNDLGMIPTLKSLILESNVSKLTHIRGLGRLNDLTSLSLSYEIVPEVFDVICKRFAKLEVLDLGSCSGLSDADGVKLSQLKHLRMLSFRDGNKFTDRTFEQGLRSSSMKTLRVGLGCRLTNAGLESIAANHSRFEDLSFESCVELTDEGLVTLLRSEPKLEVLKLSGCSSLKGTCLIELEDICPRLRRLELIDCSIDDSAVRRFKEKRPFVKVLVGYTFRHMLLHRRRRI